MTSTNRGITASQATLRTTAACIFIASLLVIFTTGTVFAKSKKDDTRIEFQGIVQERPTDTLHGKWTIGGRVVVTDSKTEFDQHEGPLDLGSCAEVDIRNGRVHEIDSEPMRDCS
ncbi:MAG: hypothetical protein V2I36_14340 [Desulfopila sp.]|jgi:hypothetical protein|nr:hypothetical protein [Desulfopila sp.]